MKNRLVVVKIKENTGAGGNDYKRVTRKILMVMEIFCILTVSMSLSRL